MTKLARQGFAIIEGPLAPGGSAAMAAQVREKLTAFMEGEDDRFRDQIAQIVSEGIARGWVS